MQKGSVQALVSRWLQFRLERESKSSMLLVFPPDPARDSLLRALEAEEMHVLLADRASDAIEILETDSTDPETRVDLVVACNDLLDLTGVELMQFIRSRPYDPELLLMDKSEGPEDMSLVISLRLADFLTGSEADPLKVAAKSKKLKVVALNRRVRQQMVSDLHATLQEILPKGKTLLAEQLDRRLGAYKDELGPMDRVLIADADAGLRTELSSALMEEGLKVDVAIGGQSALVIMEEEKPDLLVVDAEMANVSEMELLNRVRKSHPDVDVVLLARKATLAEIRKALQFGVSDFIHKPIRDPSMSARRIRRVLEQKRQEKAMDLLITELYSLAATTVALSGASMEQTEATLKAFDGVLPDYRRLKEAKRPAHREPEVDLSKEQVLELLSGEYELVSGDRLYKEQQDQMPDLAVLGYIDEIIFPEAGGLGSEKVAVSVDLLRMPGGGRRAMPRVERSFMVTFGPTEVRRSTLGFLRDLSLGGLFISADPPLMVGQLVRMEILIPTDQGLHRISCQGKVVWNTLSDSDKVEVYGSGFGVEFTVIDADGSDLLRRVVAGEI